MCKDRVITTKYFTGLLAISDQIGKRAWVEEDGDDQMLKWNTAGRSQNDQQHDNVGLTYYLHTNY